jgi:hypothetical protein
MKSRTIIFGTVWLLAALFAAAGWAKDPVSVDLRIDWKALGLDPAKVKIRAPEIPGIQTETAFRPGKKSPSNRARAGF